MLFNRFVAVTAVRKLRSIGSVRLGGGIVCRESRALRQPASVLVFDIEIIPQVFLELGAVFLLLRNRILDLALFLRGFLFVSLGDFLLR